MGKALILLSTILNTAQSLFNRIATKFFSIFPPRKPNIIPTIIDKKKKSITKKQMRSYIQQKIRRRLSKNTHKDETFNDHQMHLQQRIKQFDGLAKQQHKYEFDDEEFIQFVKNKDDDLICSVCRSIILLPATTQCDHVFCLQCIQNSLIISNKCPLCRAPIANQQNYGIYPIKSVENIIKIKEQSSDEEHKNRMKEHQLWKNNRFVDMQHITEGQKVDIWKNDSKEWKKAQIKTINKNQNNTITSLLVSFDNQSKDHNQVIQLPSFRIAKYNFYSSKYDNDQFMFPEIHLRNSIRIAPQFQFSILPTFRRSLHQRLNMENPFANRPLGMLRRPITSTALVPVAPPPTYRRMLTDRTNSNQEQTQNATNVFSRSNPSDQQSQFARLQFLSSEQIRNDRSEQQAQMQINDLLPNLNPMQGMVRQAPESSSELQVPDFMTINEYDF